MTLLGIHTAMPGSGKAKSGPITPTTVYGLPSSRTTRPTTVGSAPSCARQNASLTTMTRFAPSTCSSARSVRPRRAGVPSAGKKPRETYDVRAYAGSAPPSPYTCPMGITPNAPTASKPRSSRSQSSSSLALTTRPSTATFGLPGQSRTTRSASGKGSGRRSTPRTTENIAVVAPIPRASVRRTTTEKPRARRRPRAAYTTSCQTVESSS
jgi:hypothetical protein